MLDKPEVLAEVTERHRFLPWEFDTIIKSKEMLLGNDRRTLNMYRSESECSNIQIILYEPQSRIENYI